MPPNISIHNDIEAWSYSQTDKFAGIQVRDQAPAAAPARKYLHAVLEDMPSGMTADSPISIWVTGKRG